MNYQFRDLGIVAILSVAIVIIMLLLGAGEVRAQGNDFPGGFWAPSPSWSPVPTLTPVLGWDWHSGTAAGPYYLSNQRGATIRIAFVFDWWSLGPVQFVIRTNGDDNMHWVDGGQWMGWCIRCSFEFQATGDNTVAWLEYTGTDQFGAHLEVESISDGIQTVAAAYTQEEKDRFARDAANIARAAAALQIIARVTSGSPDMIMQLISKLTQTGASAGGLAALYLEAQAADPWDDLHEYPYDPPLPDGDYSSCSGSDFGDGIAEQYCNELVGTMRWAGMNSDGAYVSANRYGSGGPLWQYDRTRDFARRLGDDLAYGAWVVAVLRDEFNGDIGYQQNHNIWLGECNCDAVSEFDNLSRALYEAGWYLQNL